LSQRVRPEVAGPMTGSAKSGKQQAAATVIPGFAKLNPGYGVTSACRPIAADSPSRRH
jgi:hypothetical protein